jgi:molybdate transport system substrate-binding protein
LHLDRWIALLVLAGSLVSAQQIRVAAASDVGPVLKRLVREFEKQSGVKTEVSTGSSGSLFAQIVNGGPYDVFLSADIDYARKLEESGFAAAGSLRQYAQGRLVLVVRSGIEGKDAGAALSSPDIRKVAIANPQHAPYGRAAMKMLEKMGLSAQMEPKLVRGENVAQAAQFVYSGNADAGLIGMSHAREMEKMNRVIVLPDGSYPPIEQAGVVIKASKAKAQAARFLEFLVSPWAQTIFAEFGFKPPRGHR